MPVGISRPLPRILLGNLFRYSPVDSAEAEITLDDYVKSTGVTSVGCGIYPTMEECRSDLNAQWFNDCEVVDTDALEVCAEWISNLECNEEGWISECDDSFECQF